VGVNEDVKAAILAVAEGHDSDGHVLCYAQTWGQILAKHQFSGSMAAERYRCTRPLGHTDEDTRGGTGDGSLHRDAAHCYTPHYFNPEMAGPPEPEHHKWQRCVKCNQTWPCDMQKIREALDAGLDLREASGG
jgi:hypothetical protein